MSEAQHAQRPWEVAKRKARYGHKSYILWHGRDGSEQYAIYSKANIKRAILDVGTQGRFYWVQASTGVLNIVKSFNYMLHLLKCAPGTGDAEGGAA